MPRSVSPVRTPMPAERPQRRRRGDRAASRRPSEAGAYLVGPEPPCDATVGHDDHPPRATRDVRIVRHDDQGEAPACGARPAARAPGGRRRCRGCRWARRRAAARGRITIARAIATRWRSPPESCSGRWSARPRSPTASSPPCHALAPLRTRHAGEDHRQLDVLGGGEPRHEVERLEDEADDVPPHVRERRRRRARSPRGRRGRSVRTSADRGSR